MKKLKDEEIQWKKYPVRTCRYLNHCRICQEHIRAGEDYYDGRYGMRAHVRCVPSEERVHASHS